MGLRADHQVARNLDVERTSLAETPTQSAARSNSEAGLFDLYKIAVEMADRVSARRATANTFFLALHAAVVTVVAALYPASSSLPLDRSGLRLLTAAGAALSVAWLLALNRYRDLNTAKYRVITDLEKQLPSAIYTDEWRLMKKKKIGFTELGQVERLVPIVFTVIYGFAWLGS